MTKVVLIPGNHDSRVDEIWFPSVINELSKLDCNVVAKNMPDPITAKKDIWLPFMEKDLQIDNETIGVGHSSGAIALLKYAETHHVKGLVLIGAYYTDLGDETEKESGYFDGDWDWSSINANAEFIIQFASTNDPYIPIEESRFLKTQLPKLEYIEFNDKGHMGEDVGMTEFPELVEALKNKIG
jgi:uncharacterized protein